MSAVIHQHFTEVAALEHLHLVHCASTILRAFCLLHESAEDLLGTYRQCSYRLRTMSCSTLYLTAQKENRYLHKGECMEGTLCFVHLKVHS